MEKAWRGGETGGEKGLLSDLIKGCDLNRYLIKWLLPRNVCNSPCRQNHESKGLAACYITQLGFVQVNSAREKPKVKKLGCRKTPVGNINMSAGPSPSCP